MATYQIINLETGEFATLTLEEVAALAQLDPTDIEWAIEEHGVCETETHQITKIDSEAVDSGENAESGRAKLAEAPEGDGHSGDDDDAGDGDSISPLPVFVYISQVEFEARLAESPAAVIRLKWDEPIVREAVDADRERVMGKLRGDESDEMVQPSTVYHLTREEIALVR
jgi:hypothetical protein